MQQLLRNLLGNRRYKALVCAINRLPSVIMSIQILRKEQFFTLHLNEISACCENVIWKKCNLFLTIWSHYYNEAHPPSLYFMFVVSTQMLSSLTSTPT